MISSSSSLLDRGLDTMLLVYCVLPGHPAGPPCEQFSRAQAGWFTSPLVLFEAKVVLAKVYNVKPAVATQKLVQFSAVPVTLLELDAAGALAAFRLADTHGLDLTDAVLLQLTQQHGASYLATDDLQLTQVCTRLGITAESPLDAQLRHQVAAWEKTNLTPKGLPRVLRRVHYWLQQSYSQAAQDFWSQTGNGSHLP